MQLEDRLLRATVFSSLGVFPKAIIDLLCFMLLEHFGFSTTENSVDSGETEGKIKKK